MNSRAAVSSGNTESPLTAGRCLEATSPLPGPETADHKSQLTCESSKFESGASSTHGLGALQEPETELRRPEPSSAGRASFLREAGTWAHGRDQRGAATAGALSPAYILITQVPE